MSRKWNKGSNWLQTSMLQDCKTIILLCVLTHYSIGQDSNPTRRYTVVSTE